MKSYRNAISALVLAFVFSTSAFANDDGIIHTDRTPPPPPPPPVQAEGIMIAGVNAPAPEEDILTEITLDLLQTLITLL